MNELEVLERAERIRSIPFALRILGVAVLINLIPLGMAFHEYTKDTQLGNSSRYSEDESLPPLEGPFMEKFATVVQYLIQPEQKAKAIWLKIFLVTVPVGYLLIIFGFARGPLRSLTPFFAGLAFATGLNHALLLILWQFPGAFPKAWLLLSGILGLVAVYIGTWKIARRSVLLRTAVQLTASTFLALLVTIAFPFILLGMAWHLVRKRDIPYSDFFAEAGNFYNFLIMSMYPLCFQIIPTILMTKQKGKQETRRAKKKYKKVEAPSYSSELDFDKLRVGDVILSGKPSWNNSAPIQASNVLSCDEDHRYWSHAFIYAGCRPDQKDDPNAPKRNIVESQSNGKGVQEIDMLTGEKVIYEKVDGSEKPAIKSFDENEKLQFNFDEAGNRKKFTPEQRVKFTAREKQLCFEKSYFEEGYYLMVLRPKYVDETTLEKVVEFCRKKDGEGYGYDKWGVSFYALCALVPPMMSGWLESTMAGKIFNVENAYFCSELVVDAFVKEHQQLFDRSPWRVKPLDFWMNAMFEEIDCGYRRIPQNESAKQEVEEQKAYLASLEQKARKMGETASGMEKEQLEGIVEKFRRDAIRVEKGFYPAFPMA